MMKAATVLVAAGLLLTGCVTVNVAPKPTATPAPSASVTGSADCTAQNLTLNQPGLHYTLTGTCGEISIQGQDITVSMVSAKSVTINGDRNTVTAKSLGAVSIQGQDNTMSATVVGALTINGDRNTVTAPAIGPKSVNGQANTVGG
jgi:PBP1b-binding outer membrane lipoprotein LpoB